MKESRKKYVEPVAIPVVFKVSDIVITSGGWEEDGATMGNPLSKAINAIEERIDGV